MTAKKKTQRLAALYQAQERASAARLLSAAGDLRVVEDNLGTCGDVLRAQRSAASHALSLGDQSEHSITQQLLGAAEARATRLRGERVTLQQVHDHAAALHLRSRREAAQMDELLKQSELLAQQDLSRREQAEADDRFAALRHYRSMTER